MINTKLFNYHSDDIVISYPLIYLHGSIVFEQRDTDDESDSKKTIEKNGALLTCVNKELKTSHNWQLINSQFKVFCFLQNGSNTVEIRLKEHLLKTLTIHYIKEDNKRYVLPFYIVCKNSDGSFLSPNKNANNTIKQAVKKLQFNCRLIQTYFAESLYEHKFERKTFRFKEDEDGTPSIQILHSDLDIKDVENMNGDQLYDFFHKEISTKFKNYQFCKYLVFMSCTIYKPPKDVTEFKVKDIMSYVRGHTALGGDNMALFGTGSLHTWADDLNDLYARFTDTTMIDRKKNFDDSCGRGSHWANYSTTIGATIHELGHCFDLAHTPHGIMSRGHDDMNCFYVVTSNDKGKDFNKNKQDVQKMDDRGKYKGAHWHRASAVILNYNKWFNNSQSDDQHVKEALSVSLHPDLLGPFGETKTDDQKNIKVFNSNEWLNSNSFTLNGIIFYYDKYLYGIQFIGFKEINTDDITSECKGEETLTEVFGSSDPSFKRYVFRFQFSDEVIEKIEIRSGAWLDGIKIFTNYKSTIWIGGDGGNHVTLEIPRHRKIKSWFGQASTVVNSLSFLLQSSQRNLKPDNSPEKYVNTNISSLSNIFFTSKNGIRLVEFRKKNGEIKYHREYVDTKAPLNMNIPIHEIMELKTCDENEKENEDNIISGMIYDDVGNNQTFCYTKTYLKYLLNQVAKADI